MSVVYVNNFDHLLHHGPFAHTVVAASVAAFDPPIVVPGQPIAFLGPMHAGSSEPEPKAKIATVPVEMGQPPHQWKLTEGTSVTVLKATAYESRTFYVVAGNEVLLSRGSVFEAELVFDKPMATLDPGASGKFWAVALNFKTGDARDRSSADPTDPSNDGRVGVTCQFNDGGFVKFHGIQNGWNGPATDTYGDYDGDPVTEFHLTVSMIVNNGAISGMGVLRYGTTVEAGELTVPPYPTPEDPPIDASKLTAVGVALTTTKGGFEDFGARLRSFTLSVT